MAQAARRQALHAAVNEKENTDSDWDSDSDLSDEVRAFSYVMHCKDCTEACSFLTCAHAGTKHGECLNCNVLAHLNIAPSFDFIIYLCTQGLQEGRGMQGAFVSTGAMMRRVQQEDKKRLRDLQSRCVL